MIQPQMTLDRELEEANATIASLQQEIERLEAAARNDAIKYRHAVADVGRIAADTAAAIASLQQEKERASAGWYEVGALCNEKAATVALLRELLKECSDDLAAELKNTYDGTLQYPTQRRRYERDMDIVDRANAALSDGETQ